MPLGRMARLLLVQHSLYFSLKSHDLYFTPLQYTLHTLSLYTTYHLPWWLRFPGWTRQERYWLEETAKNSGDDVQWKKYQSHRFFTAGIFYLSTPSTQPKDFRSALLTTVSVTPSITQKVITEMSEKLVVKMVVTA